MATKCQGLPLHEFQYTSIECRYDTFDSNGEFVCEKSFKTRSLHILTQEMAKHMELFFQHATFEWSFSQLKWNMVCKCGLYGALLNEYENLLNVRNRDIILLPTEFEWMQEGSHKLLSITLDTVEHKQEFIKQLTNPLTFWKPFQKFQNDLKWVVDRKRAYYKLEVTGDGRIPSYDLFRLQFMNYTDMDSEWTIFSEHIVPLDTSFDFFVQFDNEWFWHKNMIDQLTTLLCDLCFPHHQIQNIVRENIVNLLT